MDLTAIITSLLTLLAGIGVFLIACQMMSSNLEAASSERLKKLFSKASDNKLLGVGIGALGTAAIQSSGATTVMTIGFVNAGIISLAQAATIIYGANIGTTVTAQIVALGMFGGNSVSTSIIFSAFAGLGAFLSIFAKRNRYKTVGGILAGFGLLFVGLALMSGSMEAFAALEGVKTFLSGIRNPLLLVLLGAIFTAIIQSSSVMTSIALAMVVTGLIGIDQGIYLTMGSNIGSCVVAVIAGVTSGTNAKRTALIHLLFNCSGVVLFMLAAWGLGWVDISYGSVFERLFPAVPQVQLAMFHTFFNTVTVAIMLPFTGTLVNVVKRMIP
ncbi:MAG: Na/Pi cotransporter family protein, partial [Bacteroidales bacterium]|nr:Na/Pi cotransporter family protein [Bacteroidales bacterium]